MLYGYDVSEFQGTIDFDALKADFLIIRDVYATTHVDDQFARNLAQCRAHALPRWTYSFVEPAWTSPLDSMSFTLRAHDAYQPGEGQVIDVERDIGASLVSWVAEWWDRFYNATGLRSIVYLNRDLLAKYDWTPLIQRNAGLWLAVGDGAPEDYAFDLHGWPVLAAKQYILDGPPVPGVNAHIDSDTFNGDAVEFGKYGASGPIVVPPAPPPPPPPPPPVPAGHAYVIESGDTLSGIAARCGIGWRDLWNFDGNRSAIPNPDLIFAGQTIQTPCDAGSSPHTEPSSCDYAVQAGDTLSSIAAAHGMTWPDLWNYDGNRDRIDNPDLIFAGQSIKVPC